MRGRRSDAGSGAAALRELSEEASIDLGRDTELIAWSRWITRKVSRSA